MRRLSCLSTLTLAVSVACVGREHERAFVSLDHQSTSMVDLSANSSIALLNSGVACVVNSYEVVVQCVDRRGADWARLGGEGEGPGEFASMTHVVRGDHGQLGVVDIRLARLTVYRPPQHVPVMIAELPPILFRPLGEFGTLIHGTYVRLSTDQMSATMWSDPRSVADAIVFGAIDVASGDIVSEEPLPHPSQRVMDSECTTGLSHGTMTHGGTIAFTTCQSEVVYRDTFGTMNLMRAPTYVPELPNERDIQEYRDLFRRMGNQEVPDALLRTFAETPKKYGISGRSLVFDGQDRLWVATQRDRDHFSFLDVFDGEEFVGTVRVRDRILGFDILDLTLATLVERSPSGGEEDIRERGVDWYDLRSDLFR